MCKKSVNTYNTKIRNVDTNTNETALCGVEFNGFQRLDEFGKWREKTQLTMEYKKKNVSNIATKQITKDAHKSRNDKRKGIFYEL